MGGKIKSAFRGMRYARYAVRTALDFANGVVQRIAHARYVALVVIAFAIIMYASPYFLDAAQCIIEVEQPRSKCLQKTYNQARRDSNLAAIIIALAVTLAAWRPERYPPRRRRAPARARRRSLRNADANAPR